MPYGPQTGLYGLQIHELLSQGVGLLECARRLNLSLNTVKLPSLTGGLLADACGPRWIDSGPARAVGTNLSEGLVTEMDRPLLQLVAAAGEVGGLAGVAGQLDGPLVGC
ncbi:MAG: hypothetical protein K0R62_8598, partial [Nonomuraea muscovyensis]|nr:hypothetical protein [Nonomuraea muscovyensis]